MVVIECLRDRLASREYAPRTREQYARLTKLVEANPLAWLEADQKNRAAAQALINAQLVAGHGRTAEQLYVWLRTCCPAMMAGARRPRYARKRPKYLTVDQARRLLAAAEDKQVWMAIALALSCGLRRGELCGLRWCDIDMDQGVMYIQNQRQRITAAGLVDAPPKSEAGYRELPIPRHLADFLSEWYLLQQADALLMGRMPSYVLPGPRGNGIDPHALDRAFQGVCRAAGVECTLHGLRHTMASMGACAGVSMPVLQALLGHSSPQTTAQYYTHAYPEAKHSALEVISFSLRWPKAPDF